MRSPSGINPCCIADRLAPPGSRPRSDAPVVGPPRLAQSFDLGVPTPELRPGFGRHFRDRTRMPPRVT